MKNIRLKLSIINFGDIKNACLRQPAYTSIGPGRTAGWSFSILILMSKVNQCKFQHGKCWYNLINVLYDE